MLFENAEIRKRLFFFKSNTNEESDPNDPIVLTKEDQKKLTEHKHKHRYVKSLKDFKVIDDKEYALLQKVSQRKLKQKCLNNLLMVNKYRIDNKQANLKITIINGKNTMQAKNLENKPYYISEIKELSSDRNRSIKSIQNIYHLVRIRKNENN